MLIYSDAARDDDAPMYIAYALLSDNNFYYQYAVKPVVAYLLFIDMIGRDEFKRAFQEFANRWVGKHPTPYDMFFTFNDVLGENFNWFWKSWFFDFGYPDLALEVENNSLIVKRVGAGSLPVPVKLKIKYKNGQTITIEKSMNVWKDGKQEIVIPLKDWINIKVIETDNLSVPDIDKSNNIVLLNQ
jgi:aminopeptidase N